MNIEQLRKMRSTDFSKIKTEFEKVTNPQSDSKSFADDRFWKLDPDKAGNASATIRFLPRAEGDELPWVKVYNHGFQGPSGKWYIENSLTTIGEKDPVGEKNSLLWNTGSDADKETARKQKRKLSHIANILVVNDPKHPEFNGKVMLFRFGKKIFDKIMDKANPTFEDEDPVNVFDLWDGADFKLKQIKVEGYPNYDKSTFAEAAPVAGGDEEEILEIVNKQYKLAEFVSPSNFKSYEELARKFATVMNSELPSPKATEIAAGEDDDYVAPSRTVVEKKKVPTKAKAEESGEDEDSALDFFRKIAAGD